MIRAKDLSLRFGHHVILDRVEMAVDGGERVALLGLNGAGKTTLIRCALGLIPFSGELTVAGRDVRSESRAARARVGYVPQRAPHFDGTLSEMVDFFGQLRNTEPGAIEQRLAELDLPLGEHGHKAVRILSGGMLQKVLLAIALGSNVELLLLDEPTANLDARARREFLRALQQVDRRTTVLLASHRLADVDAVADRLLVLHRGSIAFDGKASELWARVGADVTLWIRVPPPARTHAAEHLRTHCRLTTVLANGAALGVRVERTARADVIAELRSDGFEIEDFWTEAPSLSDLLEHVLETPIDATPVRDQSVGVDP